MSQEHSLPAPEALGSVTATAAEDLNDDLDERVEENIPTYSRKSVEEKKGRETGDHVGRKVRTKIDRWDKTGRRSKAGKARANDERSSTDLREWGGHL
ncbi:hypothetical protein BHM03_00022524 [Ensete ventricosum]|uniref:Uncharacterized protein n=1 Tax=Ensete ventricosum TaxID=4639 RepID=A0A445MGH1_ENSVE|nr:hypothetical protein BHM03_00022524 [Ensete ventricosum]